MLKSYLRRVNVQYLAWNPNKESLKNSVTCDGGRILTALHVHQQLDGHLALKSGAKPRRRSHGRFPEKKQTKHPGGALQCREMRVALLCSIHSSVSESGE